MKQQNGYVRRRISKIASEVRIINLAKEMGIKIITKGEPGYDRSRTKETLLSDKP